LDLSKSLDSSAKLDAAIVLAAGEGTRMKSQTPKVLHFIAGRTIIDHVLSQVSKLNPTQLRVVVGAGREAVEPHTKQIAPNSILYFKQSETAPATQFN